MADIWQGQYWENGSVAFGSSNSYASGYYDSSTGFCNYSKSGGSGFGNLIAGKYGGVYNVAGLRFVPGDNYSKVVVTCYNANGYTNDGNGSVKYLITTSQISNPTQTIMNGYTATGTYTCTTNSYGANTLTFNYNFKKNTVYYIYFWSNGENQTWRFRWYAPTANNYGFSATYTTVPVRKLYTNCGVGAWVTINRTSSAFASTGVISHNADIYPNDKLYITYGLSEGYGYSSHTVADANFASGGTYTVDGTRNVPVAVLTYVLSYTLKISAGTGASISVSRTSSPKGGASTGALSNNATIYHSDVLSISTSFTTGYEVVTQSHTNGSYTVKGAVSVSATAKKKTFTFTITGDSGVASATGSGTYEYGTSVTSTVTAKTGYHLVNYVGTNSDGNGTDTWTGCSGLKTHQTTWAIKANRTIKVNSALDTFKLTVSEGEGSTISVKRNGSVLSNGATITYGDVLQITFTTETGYKLTTHTVNGTKFTSGNSITVTDNVSIVTVASLLTYKLTITANQGGTVKVNRKSSKAGSIGNINSGAKLYYGDTLEVVFTTQNNSKVVSATVNGNDISSGATHTVTTNVTVAVVFNLIEGTIYIFNGTTFDMYHIYIYNGTTWERYAPYVYNGVSWDMCN